MASSGTSPARAKHPNQRFLNLTFALGVAVFFWAFVGGLAYLVSVHGALPLRTDPLAGARQRARRGDLEGAVREYRVAALIEPTDVRAMNELGELLARAGRYDDSLAAFEKVVRVRPDARALAGIAEVLLAQGQHAQAAELYERSLELAPKQAVALRGLGMARALQGDLDRAIAAFEASLKVAPDAPARANLQRARAEKARLEQPRR